jgi:hypothetical protein
MYMDQCYTRAIDAADIDANDSSLGPPVRP